MFRGGNPLGRYGLSPNALGWHLGFGAPLPLRNASGDEPVIALRSPNRESAPKFERSTFRRSCFPRETPPLHIGFPHLMGIPQDRPTDGQLHQRGAGAWRDKVPIYTPFIAPDLTATPWPAPTSENSSASTRRKANR